MANIVLWHGGKRWEGPPRVVESKKGRVEYGPGLYLTTSVDTARKYAKGGGSIIRFELERDLRWLEDARMESELMIAFVKSRARLRSKDKIIEDIRRYCERTSRTNIPATVLVNLMVNYQAITGDHGPALAEFYVGAGIDAGVDHKGSEDWVVLFNMKKIISFAKVPAGDARDTDRIVRARDRDAG